MRNGLSQQAYVEVMSQTFLAVAWLCIVFAVYAAGVTISNLTDEQIEYVSVEQNEVRGFHCESQPQDSEDLQICFDRRSISGTSNLSQHEVGVIEDYLAYDGQNKVQHTLPVCDDDGTKRINFRVLSIEELQKMIENGNKDKAFVAVIPSGITIFCVIGPSNECSAGGVLDNSTKKYLINESSFTQVSTPSVSPSSMRSATSYSQFDAVTSASVTGVSIAPTSTLCITSTGQTASSTSQASTTTFALGTDSAPSVSPVTAPLGGALGSLSMVLIIIIAALVTYIGYLKCKPSPRVLPKTVHEDQGRNDSSSSTFSNEVAIHEISSDEESNRN